MCNRICFLMGNKCYTPSNLIYICSLNIERMAYVYIFYSFDVSCSTRATFLLHESCIFEKSVWVILVLYIYLRQNIPICKRTVAKAVTLFLTIVSGYCTFSSCVTIHWEWFYKQLIIFAFCIEITHDIPLSSMS